MEFIAHITYSTVCLLNARSKGLFENYKVFILGSTFLCILIYRLAGADEDLKVYLLFATYDINLSFYYLREPIIWYGLIFFHTLTDNPLTSIILMDLALLISLGIPITRQKHGAALLLLWCASFIFLLGLQNIYRQYASMTFVLGSLLWLSEREKKWAFLYYLLAVLSHNAAIFIFPIFVYRYLKKNRLISLLVSSVVVVSILELTASQKSFSATGSDVREIYITVYAVLTAVYICICSTYRLSFENVFAWGLISYLYFILGSAQFERAAMYFLLIIVYDLVAFEYRRPYNFNLIYTLLFCIFVPSIYVFGTRFIMFTNT